MRKNSLLSPNARMQIPVDSAKDTLLKKKCLIYSSYANLEQSLSDNFPSLNKEEKEKYRQSRVEQRKLREVNESKQSEEKSPKSPIGKTEVVSDIIRDGETE